MNIMEFKSFLLLLALGAISIQDDVPEIDLLPYSQNSSTSIGNGTTISEENTFLLSDASNNIQEGDLPGLLINLETYSPALGNETIITGNETFLTSDPSDNSLPLDENTPQLNPLIEEMLEATLEPVDSDLVFNEEPVSEIRANESFDTELSQIITEEYTTTNKDKIVFKVFGVIKDHLLSSKNQTLISLLENISDLIALHTLSTMEVFSESVTVTNENNTLNTTDVFSAEQDLSTSLQNLGKAALSADKDLDIDKVMDFAKKIPQLDNLEDLEGLTKLDPSNFPVVGEGEYLLKEKCTQNGHNQSYDEVLQSLNRLGTCVMKFVKPEEMHIEIERAKPRGELDEVFKKYCRQTPELKGCVRNFTNTMGQCLSEKEQETKDVIYNVTTSIINFICFKEGDRIALFIAEGGPECLTSNVENIMDCVNATLDKYSPTDAQDNQTLPEFVIKKEYCDDMTDIQKCVVKVLENCKEPTPANIVESMFKFVRKSTPCHTYDTMAGGTNSLYSSLSLVTLILTSQLLARL